MIYSLLVLSSPVSGQVSRTAAEFAHSVISRGHTLHRVFFLDAGTVTSSAALVFPQDEPDPTQHWIELAQAHSVELIICISSALRHGMLDPVEAERYERPSSTVNPVFTISGLGQLVDACMQSDRMITFGG